MGKSPQRREVSTRDRRALTLIDIVVLIVVLALGAMLLLPALSAARHSARKRGCIGNLRSLGMLLTLYVEKFGSNTESPPADGVATIFSTLRGIPDSATAVTSGNEKLYTCDALGTTMPSRGTSSVGIDYASYDGTAPGHVYPGARLTETAPSTLVIAADPQENHGGHDDGNFLYFQGNVEARRWDDFSREAYGAKNLSGATHSFP